MKNVRSVVLSALAILIAGVSLTAFAGQSPAAEAQKQSVSDEAGAAKGDVKWTCPMHLHYIADQSGACPICGMDLVKVDAGSKAAGAGDGPQRTAIVIAPETMQTMGVRIAKAEASNFGRIVRSYGRIAENERLQTEMSARTEGWIEELKIRAVGDQVKEGDLLFSMYAPEFIVSQRDYVDALNGRSGPRIKSIRTRLKAFGMQDRTIEELEQKRAEMEFVPFYADRDGTVAMIELRPGSYVKRGTILTRIQDYSQVWLMVSVSEKDLTLIKPGTAARVTFPNIPGREIYAKVEYVYPTVDAKTRTGQVRLVLDNADGQLRPGAYADVAFEVGAEMRLAVPTEAILNSGGARYVVASLGEGRFEPRAVSTGVTSGPWTEISGEIAAGDDIVVSGQFLIDSESALRESFRKLERLQLPLSLIKLDETQFAMIDHMVDAALYIHEALIDGYDVEAKFLEPALEIKALLWPKFQHTKLAFVMEDAAKAIEKGKAAQTESETRAALAELVAALEPWMREGAPRHYAEKKLLMLHDAESDAKWLQMAGKPANPYGSGTAEAMPWPESKPDTAVSAEAGGESPAASPAPNPSQNPAMSGHQH